MTRKILIFSLLFLVLCMNCAGAVTNLKANGDFDLFPNSPIKYGSSWIGNESTKWCVYYTSNNTQHSAQLLNGTLVTETGDDKGINDISCGGVSSSDPTFATWSTYGTVVNASTNYTAFMFVNVNKTNSVYFNVRQAYANGTMLSALISPRNTGTGYQFLEYQFRTSPGIHWVRVGLVTRASNTKTTYYAAGAYQGDDGVLNKQTSILSISPITSILEDMQPTFTGSFNDVDSTVGIDNIVNLNINGVVYPYNTDGYYKNNLFLPDGVNTYNVTVIDNWNTDTISETYSLFVPTISYVDVVGDETDTSTIFTGLFSERFIYFVVYIAIMVLLQSKFSSTNTLLLFELIEILVMVILLSEVNNINEFGGTLQYILMCVANAYLIILTVMGIKNRD